MSNHHRAGSTSALHAHHHYKYLATCLPGLAPVLQSELECIPNIQNIQTSGTAAVLFESDTCRVGLEALVWTRSSHRVMEYVGQGFGITTRNDLYDAVQSSVNIKDLLGNGKGGLLTLSVHVVFTNPKESSARH